MTTPIELKIAGRRPNTTIKQCRNASIEASEQWSMEQRPCLHPDYPDVEIAQASIAELYEATPDEYDESICGAIQEMHARMLEAAGRGSWPNNCTPDLYPHENYHSALLWIDVDSFLRNSSLHREVTDQEWKEVVVDARVWPSVDKPVASVAEAKKMWSYDSQDSRVRVFERPEWRQASSRQASQPFTVFDLSTWLVLESTRRAGCFFVQKFDGENGTHNVHEKHIPIPGGVSGFAYFNNATCGDHVTSNIDNTLSYSLGRACGLRTHEFGHNLNLQHEFRSPQSTHRSIMSYAQDNSPFQGYRLSGSPYQYVEDHSWDVLRRFFGGEAAKPIEVTPPRPPAPEAAPPITGVLNGRQVGGVFIIDGTVTIDYSQGEDTHQYIAALVGDGRYQLQAKPGA